MHSVTYASKTLEVLNQQRLSKTFTDFNVVVGEEIFCLHRSLIAAHSLLLKRALESSSLKKEPFPSVSLMGVDANPFSIIIEFLYTATLQVTCANVSKLLATAKLLEIADVVELCNQFSSENRPERSSASTTPSLDDSNIDSTNDEAITTVEIQPQNIIVETDDFEPLGGRKRGRKPVERFDCPVCGKTMTENRLKTHIRTHTGEKGATCRTCNKTFATIYNLKIHERTHTGERPYQCTLCPRAFADPSSLCKHKLWHLGVKRHKCTTCGRAFSTRAHMVEHMRTHTREEPYVCDKCDRSFIFHCDLTRHQKIHRGDFLGPCPYCGRTFTHTGNYKTHLRTHERKLGVEPKVAKKDDHTMGIMSNQELKLQRNKL